MSTHDNGTDELDMKPDPDCRVCKGRGFYGTPGTHLTCDCTLYCTCGEIRPDNLARCQSPGCKNTGCDSCGYVEWCHSVFDELDGDYFCEECG